MAVRVTDAEVKEIIETTINTVPFIIAANLLVTNTLGSTGLSAATLTEIERWVSAHLVAIRVRQATKEKIADAEITFEGNQTSMGKGLLATTYGQQAIMLDTTGALSSLGKKKASIEVAG